jgi:hypothetical protein
MCDRALLLDSGSGGFAGTLLLASKSVLDLSHLRLLIRWALLHCLRLFEARGTFEHLGRLLSWSIFLKSCFHDSGGLPQLVVTILKSELNLLGGAVSLPAEVLVELS